MVEEDDGVRKEINEVEQGNTELHGSFELEREGGVSGEQCIINKEPVLFPKGKNSNLNQGSIKVKEIFATLANMSNKALGDCLRL